MRRSWRSASPYEGLIGFSRAVRCGERIFVSGTAPIADNGETVVGDAYVQAKRCLEIVVQAVEALGGRCEDVVRTRMYMVDAADWDAVGRAHGEVFGEVFPAATMVVVSELLDPRWKVEIEVEAVVGSAAASDS